MAMLSLVWKPRDGKYHVKGRGNAAIQPLLAWQNLSSGLNDYLTGSANYYFDGVFLGEEDQKLSIHSDLTGLVSSLPYPLQKEDPKESLILVYQGHVTKDQELHEIDVGALNIDYLSNPKKGIDRNGGLIWTIA